MLLISFLLLGHNLKVSVSELVPLGPVLTAEPPALVAVGTAGARLHCAASGDPPPRISWLASDGSPLLDEPGVRRMLGDGSLQVLRVRSSQAVRCRAASPRGAVLSRVVTLEPVADTGWEAVVDAQTVSAGGVGALRCRASAAVPVRVAVWYRAGRALDLADPRYLSAGDTLLIRDVTVDDAAPYSCVARHAHSDVAKRSRPTTLNVISGGAGGGGGAPRLAAAAGELSVSRGADFCLPCAATDYPAPHYTWYRERDGRLQPVQLAAAGVGAGEVGEASLRAWAGGAALCGRATPDLAGAWLCKAYNGFGDATVQLRLNVDVELNVTVTPSVVVAEPGSTVTLNCSTNVAASLSWLHDGAALAAAGGRLVLRGAARAHRGMYQCAAARGARSALAAAELRLADSAPELVYTFIEQALRAGGSAALRCVAAASPPPRVTWLLDGQPIEQFLPHHRYRVSEETTPLGDVASLLNVSVTPADGGRYTCRAHNALGAVEHSARLNVYGPPAVRALGPVRVVAGENVTIHCPYSGYPISSVWWRRAGGAGGAALAAAGRAAARGGALRLQPARPSDAARYTCGVTAPGGATAAGDIDIQVRNPPKISPFMFSSELTEGSTVQVLCGVSSGDKPMYFSWLKDGHPIPTDLQIEEKSLNEFSLLMFSDLTARHSGDYTCRVSNHAATANYTATLSVKVAPSWITEPLDAAVLLGAPLLLECAAKGYPTPVVTWFRRLGSDLETMDRWEATGVGWGESAGFSYVSSGAERGEAGGGVARARLSARAAARTQQGVYRCTADNGVGAPLLKHVNVTVHEPAHFSEAGGAPRNVSAVRGAAAALACDARGDAPLAVRWTHRARTLDLDSFRWTISETRSGEGLRSVLKLRAAEREDAGEYRCQAHNRFGRSELIMFLHVEEPPEAPQSVQLGGTSTRWIRVRWRARSEANVQYSALCTSLQTLPTPDDTTLAINLTLETGDDDTPDSQGYRSLSSKLEGLRPAAAYSLRLIASNHVGQSPHSEPLLFTTLEEAPSGTPQNIHVKPLNTEELHVSWSAPAQHTWNGELLGYVVSWRELSRLEEDSAEWEGVDEGAGLRAGSAVSVGWSSTEITLAGLREFARYALTLRAYNAAGAGPHSPVVYATTADGVPETAPTDVSCVSEGARSLRVRWTPPRAALNALSGYDVLYAPLHNAPTWRGAGAERALGVAGAGAREAALALRAAAGYSLRVRARSPRGPGPASPPLHCATHDDVPGAVETLRAVATSHDRVRVAWLPPAERTARLTHYTLHIRELARAGGEWSQRVEVEEAREADAAGEAGDEGQEGEEGAEMSAEVSGLRARAAFEFRVRAHAASGAGPRSRAAAAATAQPDAPVGARIWSVGRVVRVAAGARLRLRCAAAGDPPPARRWSPLPPPHEHTLTDPGDLLLHKVESDGNYTCSVRNAAGSDRVQYSVRVLRVPAAPVPRLLRATSHALHLAWDPPLDNGSPVLGYSVWWRRAWAGGGRAGGGRARSAAAARAALALRGLACGARYAVWLHAHNALGASPPSQLLTLRTVGDKAKAPPGKELIWANSTALRLNLLTWGGRCPVARWTVTVADTDLPVDGDSVTVNNLEPGTWYEIRVTAYSPAGETTALYRAATLTVNGERIGSPTELPLTAGAAGEGVRGAGGGAAGGGGGAWRGAWRGAAAAALAAAALALLGAGAALAAARLRAPPNEPDTTTTKKLPPPDSELMGEEISPYATFSMSSCATGAGGERGGERGGDRGGERSCALHLQALARADSLELAPPPRPHLASHTNDYGSGSESSGSPCAACAAELYRVPAARLADTLPAGEWDVEERRSARRGLRSARGAGGAGGAGAAGRAERGGTGTRRDPRHSHVPTARYFSAATLQARRDEL